MGTVFLGSTIIGLTVEKLFLMYLFLFLVGSVLGYAIEVLFRRFITAHRWVNPGFMKGPWLPLYGFGLLLMFTFCWVLTTYLPSSLIFYNPLGDLFGNGRPASGATVADLIPISIMSVSLILLEFIAGLIFVKGFKVRLWDYSNLKGNILGIICPEFSLIWTAVSILFYYAMDPFVYQAFGLIFTFMFGAGDGSQAANVVFIFFMGVVYGIMLLDFIKSINIFTKIVAMANRYGFVAGYEKFREENQALLALSKKKLVQNLPPRLTAGLSHISSAAVKSGKFMTFLKKLTLIDPTPRDSSRYDDDGRPAHADSKDDSTPS
jgi:uncharacterized membrane protein